MSDQAEAAAESSAQRRRTRRPGNTRSCRIAISVDQSEQAELEQAARAEGLTASAFVAQAALAAAQRTIPPATAAFREAVTHLIRATVQVQRVGTNLNQAVAALNATGQAPGNLIPYAQYAARVIERVEQIAEKIGRQLP